MSTELKIIKEKKKQAESDIQDIIYKLRKDLDWVEVYGEISSPDICNGDIHGVKVELKIDI